jgi:hypothetical protein
MMTDMDENGIILLSWVINDGLDRGGTYCITRDGTTVDVGTWSNGVPIIYEFQVGDLSGDFEFILTFTDEHMNEGIPSSVIVQVQGPDLVADFFINHFSFIIIIVGAFIAIGFYSGKQVKKIKKWKLQLQSTSLVLPQDDDMTNRINRKRRALLSYIFPDEKIEVKLEPDETELEREIEKLDDIAMEFRKLKKAPLLPHLFCVQCRKLIRDKGDNGHSEALYCPICKKSLVHMIECPYCSKKIAMKNYAKNKNKLGQCPSCKKKFRVS